MMSISAIISKIDPGASVVDEATVKVKIPAESVRDIPGADPVTTDVEYTVGI